MMRLNYRLYSLRMYLRHNICKFYFKLMITENKGIQYIIEKK